MNFNDFGAAILTLFPLMVVNNWFVIVQIYVDITGTRFTRLYFIAFWFLSVMVFLNIVVAFALEVYSSVEETILAQESKPQKEQISMSVTSSTVGRSTKRN